MGMASDLAATKCDLQVVIAAAKAEMAETRAEILTWMVGGLMGIHTVVIIGAFVVLAKMLVH